MDCDAELSYWDDFSEYASDTDTIVTETGEDDEASMQTILGAAEYFESAGPPSSEEEEAFCRWVKHILHDPDPKDLLWGKQKVLRRAFSGELELHLDSIDDQFQPGIASLGETPFLSTSHVNRGNSPVFHMRRSSGYDMEEDVEQGWQLVRDFLPIDRLQLQQAIFTFFFRAGIALDLIAPASIVLVRGNVSDDITDGISAQIPVSRSPENRHLWWCLPNPDAPGMSAAKGEMPESKLLMCPTAISLVLKKTKRGRTTSFKFDRRAEKRQLSYILEKISEDILEGRPVISCQSITATLMQTDCKLPRKMHSDPLRDSSGSLLKSKQRKLYLECLIKWASGDVSRSKTLPACYILSWVTYPVEQVNGLRKRLEQEKITMKLVFFASLGYISLHRCVEMGDIDFDHMIAKGAGGRVFLGHWKRKVTRKKKKPRALPGTLFRGVKRRNSNAGLLVDLIDHSVTEVTSVNVAIKSTNEDYVGFCLEEFLFETALMSVNLHPNILPCMGAFADGPSFFHITPLQPDGSLEQALKAVYEPLPWKRRISILLVVAEVMAFLHSHKIVYRDLKSSNVLLGGPNGAYVADFGTARFINSWNSAPLEKRIGTPGWMAPEMFSMTSKKYTTKVDIFSFGILISEILTRQLPFAQFSVGGGYVDTAARIEKGERPILRLPKLGFCGGDDEECPKQLEDPLCDLAERCWAEQPSKRPSSEKVVEAIRHISSLL